MDTYQAPTPRSLSLADLYPSEQAAYTGWLRLGYGFAAFGDHFTATPEIAVGLSDAGRDYSLGWRLAGDDGTPDGNALELAVEVRRRESTAHDKAPPEHAAAIRATSRF